MNSGIENTYQLIKNKVLNHEVYQNIKDYSKAKEKMKTYLEIVKSPKDIDTTKDVDTKYGKSIIKEYSQRLTNEFGKKYI